MQRRTPVRPPPGIPEPANERLPPAEDAVPGGGEWDPEVECDVPRIHGERTDNSHVCMGDVEPALPQMGS